MDDQVVLKGALAHGRVTHFAWRRPPLAELFRHVVSENVNPVTDADAAREGDR